MPDAMTPLEPGTWVHIGLSDPNDPEGPLEAHLVSGSEDEEWRPLAWTMPRQENRDFQWMVRCFAQFHGLQVLGLTHE